MGKELIQDIKQPKRRLSEVLPKSAGAASETVHRSARAKGPGRMIGWFILIIVIVGLPVVYLGSQFLAAAVVTVTPKTATVSLDEVFRAAALPVEDENQPPPAIGYQTMTVNASDRLALSATEKETVSERASGRIVIVNRYSRQPQKLVANTRFADAAGRIYRLLEAVTVPGYTLSENELTNGEIEVLVRADKPGADYNGRIEGDLTIPGFKSDPRFEKITAKPAGEMTGGFVGERTVISPAARAEAEKELNARLRSLLDQEEFLAVPDGFLTFPAGRFYKFQSQTKDQGAGTTNLTLEADGELTSLLFSRRDLSRYLAGLRLADYDGAEALIVNFDDLKFVLRNPEDLSPPNQGRPAEIKVTGQARLVWQFDAAALKQALRGASKNDYRAIFLKFPSLVRTEVVIKPPWLKHFPSAPSQIKIVTVGVDR